MEYLAIATIFALILIGCIIWIEFRSCKSGTWLAISPDADACLLLVVTLGKQYKVIDRLNLNGQMWYVITADDDKPAFIKPCEIATIVEYGR